MLHILSHSHVQYQSGHHRRADPLENNAKELLVMSPPDCTPQQCVLQCVPRPCLSNGTMTSTVPPAPRKGCGLLRQPLSIHCAQGRYVALWSPRRSGQQGALCCCMGAALNALSFVVPSLILLCASCHTQPGTVCARWDTLLSGNAMSHQILVL